MFVFGEEIYRAYLHEIDPYLSLILSYPGKILDL